MIFCFERVLIVLYCREIIYQNEIGKKKKLKETGIPSFIWFTTKLPLHDQWIFFDVRLNGTYFQYEEIINVKRTSLILRQKVIQTCILFLGKTFPSTLYSKSQIRSVAFMFFFFLSSRRCRSVPISYFLQLTLQQNVELFYRRLIFVAPISVLRCLEFYVVLIDN